MTADYPCLRPIVNVHAGAGIVQCQGRMRLVDVKLDLPLDACITSRVLRCEKCGRTAQPEDASAE